MRQGRKAASKVATDIEARMLHQPFDPFQAMQIAGLLLVATLVATNVLPGLRRYGRWIGGVGMVLYLIAGIVFYVIGWG